jgi:oxygen-independent coproporphyrinogen-3 oxidase
LSAEQVATFEAYREEGLIFASPSHFRLSLLGEVFMGQLVKGLKRTDDRKVVDAYIEEGYALARKVAEEQIPPTNSINNRQMARRFLTDSLGEKNA